MRKEGPVYCLVFNLGKAFSALFVYSFHSAGDKPFSTYVLVLFVPNTQSFLFPLCLIHFLPYYLIYAPLYSSLILPLTPLYITLSLAVFGRSFFIYTKINIYIFCFSNFNLCNELPVQAR